MKNTIVFIAVAGALATIGCKGSPAAPFNTLQDSQITVYRLQNFDPQPAATTTTQPGAQQPTVPMIPGLPPELQTQIQQGASMLCQMLPPGSPGCGGAIPGIPATAAPPDAPRFEGFRILGTAQAMDPDLREAIIDVFGYEDNFASASSPCMYPELGFSFGGMGQPPANVLVSFGCNKAQSTNFQWPHPNNGLKDKTVKELAGIAQKLFGGG